MKKDPIVEEVRAARDAHAAKLNYDLHAIAQDARRHQKASGRRILSPGSRRRAKQR
jgi:hypothetical protein